MTTCSFVTLKVGKELTFHSGRHPFDMTLMYKAKAVIWKLPRLQKWKVNMQMNFFPPLIWAWKFKTCKCLFYIVLSVADHSSVSRLHLSGRRRPRRRRHRVPPAMSRTSSFSSITDSTMSLNIITVTLNMDTVNFLGISIVGQSNKGGDGGIYVGSIMKG